MSSQSVTVAIHHQGNEKAEGGGWLLPDGDILTCYHVIEGREQVQIRPLQRGATKVDYMVAQVLPHENSSDTLHIYRGDLALLTPAKEAERLKLTDYQYPTGNASIAEIVDGYGFPADNPAGRSGSGHTAQANNEARPEILEPVKPALPMTQGFSGSPVLSRKSKEIIGIFSSTHPASGRGYVIPIAHIARWLEESGSDKLFLRKNSKPYASDKLTKRLLGHTAPSKLFPLAAAFLGSGTLSTGQDKNGEAAQQLPAFEVFAAIKDDEEHALILADGGAGKTYFFMELAKAIDRADQKFIWLDCKKLGEKFQEEPEIEKWASNLEGIMNVICEEAALTHAWGDLVGKGGGFILADGLNEVGDRADILLGKLAAFAQKKDGVLLIANARKTTPLASGQEFKKYTIAPLPLGVIKNELGDLALQLDAKLQELLSKPQMLAIALELESIDAAGRADMFERYFEKVLPKAISAVMSGEPDKQRIANFLDVLGQDSFTILCKVPTLAFRRKRFIEELQKGLQKNELEVALEALDKFVAELIGLGIMQQTDSADHPRISFQHSLYHEWLAARHFVSRDRQEWSNRGFQAISLGNSSDDGLKLAVELVTSDRRAEFLTAMYDWRWGRVMDFVVEDIEGLSENLKEAFIGLNSLRLCDRFQHTRDAARPRFEKLSEKGNSLASKLVEISAAQKSAKDSEVEILVFLKQHFSNRNLDPEVAEWAKLLDFDTDTRLEALVSAAPFRAWSASNLLRIDGIEWSNARILHLLYQASLTTAKTVSNSGNARDEACEAGVGLRWRIVHTLGRPTERLNLDLTINLLQRIWSDKSEHVDIRFGACRALMKLALDFDDRREDIFAKFADRLNELAEQKDQKPSGSDVELKSVDGLWNASKLAPNIFPPEKVEIWECAIRDLLPVAQKAAEARGWKSSSIEERMAG